MNFHHHSFEKDGETARNWIAESVSNLREFFKRFSTFLSVPYLACVRQKESKVYEETSR